MKSFRLVLTAGLLLLASACRTGSSTFSVALPATQGDAAHVERSGDSSRIVFTSVQGDFPFQEGTPESPVGFFDRLGMTSTPTPTLRYTYTPSATATWTLFPTNTLRPSATPTSTPTPTNTLPPATPIANALLATLTDPLGTPLATWTPPPPNPAAQIADHYVFSRPIADGATNWIDRTYPYGGTAGGRLEIHHGVEFVNPGGTPILAVEAGTVFYAGDDTSTVFGPYPNYYGHVVVVQHAVTTPDGRPVYSLYGHMDRFEVQTGQTVNRGQQLGTVGATGIAMGPHLHFEVRVGDPYNFGATRNPELWIRPYPTFGTLAGRTLDAAGNRLYEVTIRAQSARITRYAFSYAGDEVNPDSVFGEHYTLGDLPADYYEISVTANGRVRYRQVVYVYPNRTTWLDIQLNN